ncbi:MAG TPA: HypC/HybG/HupF family hydrogenase formation chaperone [Ktedonobacteraceae bacterium]|nr:HypC/HybG/HupF family hydrogenase formation chaperone [Ktedonobacteraceae bacterium]
MCMGIPGQLVEIVDAEKHIGRVEVQGVTRTVHTGLLTAEEAQAGKWVLINAGMAVQALEADEASQLLEFIKELDRQFEEAQS